MSEIGDILVILRILVIFSSCQHNSLLWKLQSWLDSFSKAPNFFSRHWVGCFFLIRFSVKVKCLCETSSSCLQSSETRTSRDVGTLCHVKILMLVLCCICLVVCFLQLLVCISIAQGALQHWSIFKGHCLQSYFLSHFPWIFSCIVSLFVCWVSYICCISCTELLWWCCSNSKWLLWHCGELGQIKITKIECTSSCPK